MLVMGAVKTLALRYIDEKYNVLKNLKDKSPFSNWEDFIYDSIIKANARNN
jgi:hypothetical protein